MIPAGMPHDLTFAHRDLLYLLALPALVLLWGIVNARELRRVFAPLMRAIVLGARAVRRRARKSSAGDAFRGCGAAGDRRCECEYHDCDARVDAQAVA